MEVTPKSIVDLVAVDQGWWTKDDGGVWRFTVFTERESKLIRLREGDGVVATREKIMKELKINTSVEKIELTYQMPQWMDVDGSVKPVPIHITRDDDIDMFLAMRHDVKEMRLYVVPMQLDMTLELDGFRVVYTGMDGYSFAEVMSKTEHAKERARKAGKEAIDSIICSQPRGNEDSVVGANTVGWVGHAEGHVGYGTLSQALRHQKAICAATREFGSPSSVIPVAESSQEGSSSRVTPLTKDLFKDFNRAEGSDSSFATSMGNSGKQSANAVTGKGNDEANQDVSNYIVTQHNNSSAEGMLRLLDIPASAFARDAAPVVDDVDPVGIDLTTAGVFNVDYEGDELFVGRVFKNRDDCQVKLAVHAINRKFSYRNERTTNDCVIVKCVSDACRWRIYVVRLDNSDYFQIRTAVLEHTCPVDVRNQYQRQATTSVISQIMKAKFAGSGRGPTPGVVRESLRVEHSVNVSYWKAWRARELATDLAKGSAAGSYALLPTYFHLVEMSNPGSITDIVTELDVNGSPRFKYCFMALGACARGWTFMREVVIVDGAHLRGRYAGCLLTASAQDGNFQIFPVAFAVVDSENDMAWEWFFNNLKKIIPDAESLTFVSDRHSSIYSGLGKVYPKSTHGACIVHLQRNVAAKFKQRLLAPLIAKAARAYRKSTFYEYFGEIERVTPECAEYLRTIGFNHWTRSHCSSDRYNIMTSNVAESLNAVLKEARELPVVSTLEYIRGTLMTWFAKRRDNAAKNESPLTPKVEEMMHSNYERCTSYKVEKINNTQLNVKTLSGLSYTVDLQIKTCTCEEFNHLKIPCSHAIAAALSLDKKLHQLASPLYSSFFWSMAYNGSVYPVPDMSTIQNVPDAIATLTIHPPLTRRPPGRPKRSRYLSTGEYKRPVKKATRKCSRCHGAGHNRVTCKMPI